MTNVTILACIILKTNCLTCGSWADGNYQQCCNIDRQTVITNCHLPCGTVLNVNQTDLLANFSRTYNASHQLISETPVNWLPGMVDPMPRAPTASLTFTNATVVVVTNR